MNPKKVSEVYEENEKYQEKMRGLTSAEQWEIAKKHKENKFWTEETPIIEKLKEVKEKTFFGETWVNALKEIFGQSLFSIEKHENFIIFEYDKTNSDFMIDSMECFDKLVEMIKTCKEYEEFKTFSQDK